MRSVKCLGDEFHYQQEEEERISTNGNNGSRSTENATALSSFPSLIHLNIRDVHNLVEWAAPLPIDNSFPLLQKLEIQNCPNLRSTPNSFTFLKELNLIDTNSKAVTSILAARGLVSLTSIDISHFPELICIPLGVLLQNTTPNLQKLHIHDCFKFKGFLGVDDLNNFLFLVGDGDLNNNKDDDDDDFEEILSFSCPKINSNSNNRSNSLSSLHLSTCPVLSILPELRSFTSLRKLIIWKCGKLKQSIPYDIKKALTFLEELKVDFLQSEDEQLEDAIVINNLINLMVDQEKK